MNRIVPIIAALMVAAATPHPTSAGGCHHLYFKQAVVHHVAPQVFYFAGQATQDEAVARKAIRAELPAIVEAVRQSLQAPAQSQVAGVLGSKCAKCHQGDNAKGGFNLDEPVSDYHFSRTVEILSGFNVPAAMKGVVDGMQPADKGNATEEMIRKRLSARPVVAKPEPEAVPPKSEPGVLR